MNIRKLIFLVILFPVTLLAQENYATVIFEKNSSEGDDELLYYVFNELGKVETGRIKDTPLKISARKDTLDYCYISNTFNLTSFFYFEAGDTIRIIQNENWDLQYAGSHEKEYQLIADLHKKNIISFSATYEKPKNLGLGKSLPYIANLYSKGLQVVDSFLVDNPGVDKGIIEMIKIDLRYKIFGNPLYFYSHQVYSDTDYNNISPFLENEFKEMGEFSNNYDYGGYFSNSKVALSESLYFNHTKERVLRPYEKEYPNQIRDMLNYFLSLPDFLREDAIYYTLSYFFNYQKFGDIAIREFTSPFFQIATSPKRIQKVKKWDSFYGYLQDSKNQADYIIRAPELREFPLEQLDGTVITFGELFDNLKGSPIYMDFWATWCGPCRVEMNKLSSDFFNDKDTKMVYLSIDEDKEKWKNVADQNYMFDGQVMHFNLRMKNIIIQRLFDGGISIPRYIYINASQTELHKNAMKPTQFDWE